MAISIRCIELGMECPFETKGETEEAVLESVMHHVHAEHSEELEDWLGIEEIYQSARKTIHEKAA